MADFSKPTITSNYGNFVNEVNSKVQDVALAFDPLYTSSTNIPTNTIRFNSASGIWERWNGSAWVAAATTYNVNVSTANQLTNARTINGVSFNGTSNINVNCNNAVTFNNSGSGVASGSTYNGSGAITISHNTVGAQPLLGFNPVQQGGGIGQGNSKVYIGWLSSQLGLQVDSTNFSNNWPINITGNAASATNATTASTANAVDWSNVQNKPTVVSPVSNNRPGVTKLYRNDSDDPFNVQTTWGVDRSGYWSLRGYNADSYHAGCFVAYSGYSDSSGNADTVDGWHADALRAWSNVTGKPAIATSGSGNYWETVWTGNQTENINAYSNWGSGIYLVVGPSVPLGWIWITHGLGGIGSFSGIVSVGDVIGQGGYAFTAIYKLARSAA